MTFFILIRGWTVEIFKGFFYLFFCWYKFILFHLLSSLSDFCIQSFQTFNNCLIFRSRRTISFYNCGIKFRLFTFLANILGLYFKILQFFQWARRFLLRWGAGLMKGWKAWFLVTEFSINWFSFSWHRAAFGGWKWSRPYFSLPFFLIRKRFYRWGDWRVANGFFRG